MESLKLYVLIASYTSLICLKNNPDAALGDVCLSDPSVCDTNIEVCNGTNCVCTETHYDSGGVCMFKKAYGAGCSRSDECGVPAGGIIHCVVVSVVSRCLCTERSYWTGLLCQDVSDLVPALMLSNPTLSTIHASWTTPPAAEYSSVYKLTWATGGTAVGSQDNIFFRNFRIEGLTAGTEYTVSIERRIIENNYRRVQTVPEANMVKATKKGYGADCSQSSECGVPSGGNNQCVAVSGGSKCLCTIGKYWTGSLCQDVSSLVPVLTLYNPTLSTIDGFWTSSAAAFNDVYKLTWSTGGTAVGSRENIAGGNFQIEGLTEGTEYTVSIERRITETTYWRVQTVPGANMMKATIPATTDGLTTATTLMAPNISIAYHKAEGMVAFYTVRLQRGEPPAYDKQIVVGGANNTPMASFPDVRGGLEYILTIITYSYNIPSAPFTAQIRVRPEASEAVVELAHANITSRSASVSWRRPGDTKGDLYLYSLEVRNSSKCVQQILVNCTDCKYMSSSISPNCDSKSTTDISNTNLNDPAYLVKINLTLFPDTTYNIFVVAYNENGKGRDAYTTLQTLTEVPGDPTDFRYVSKTSNSIHLIWTPPMPRPGVTEYNITVYEWQEDVQQFTQINVIEQLGYYNSSITITGLSSYWRYRFQNIARTSKGHSGSVNITEVTTDESAPTKVVNLHSKNMPGVFNQIGLFWSCPAQKDGRNGVIKKSTVRYSSDTPNEDISPIQDTRTFINKDCSWNVTVVVTAGFNYTFEVFITNSMDGQPSVIYEYVEVGLPSLKNTEHPILRLVSGSETDTSVVLDVCPACFLDNKNGVIIKSGLLVCRLGNCPLRPNIIEKGDDYDRLPNWEKAKGVSFTSLYRTTDNDWMKGKLHSEQEKFILGGENCALADQNRFCNGPLPVDHTYWVWLFACTSAGCTEGDHLEFTLKEKGLSLPVTAGIIAGVIVIIVIGIVLVVVYIKFIKPRRIQKAHTKYVTDTETFNKDDTYEDITGGHRLSVIQDGRPEDDYYNTKDCPPRSDNTYDQLAVYKNEGSHEYGQINVTST